MPRHVDLRTTRLAAIILMMLALAPREVHAYIGPGAGFTVVATGLVTLAVALIVVVGLLWYPIELLRRAIARRSGRTRAPGGDLASERSTRTP
jgi:uncharacterized membrane protein